MNQNCIKYRSGYKYQLADDYKIRLNWYENYIQHANPIATEYINVDLWGLMTIKRGYAWDGPSGPTLDTHTGMRASLVHDALYQLIREGFLTPDRKYYKYNADLMLYKICREDGMDWFRATYWYYAVKWFGAPSADPKNNRKLLTTPDPEKYLMKGF